LQIICSKFYTAQSRVQKRNNKNNKDRTLSDLKHSQKVAKIEYEKIISELNVMFLKLEIITNVQFRNK